MRSFLSDLRYAIRTLGKSPGFTSLAVLVLALGIGLNTAVFSLINMLLLRSMPGESQPGRVVGLYSFDKTRPDTYREFSYPNYADIRDRNQVFSQTTALTLGMVGIGDGELTRRQFAFIVPANFFSTFGVQPAVGRGFLPEEERPGATRLVVVIGYEYWNRMGADPAVVGRTIRINARDFTIVGIAPRGFAGPTGIISPAVLLPLGVYEIVANDLFREDAHTRLDDRANPSLLVMGRLKEFPDRSMSSWLVRASANLFAVFGGLATFLSVVGVYGVRAYLVSRRSREIGIRMALGVSARDIMRLVFGEGLVLVAVGLGVGFVLAAVTGLAVASLVYEVGAFDPLIFTAAPLLLAIAALIACYVPARRATRVAPVVALRSE